MMATLKPTNTLKPLNQIQNEQKTAIQNGYNKANYQSGYGIGDSTNITGGFNSFNDSNALRNELGRVETVMGNRDKYGIGNDQYTSYYDKLKASYSPFSNAETKASNAQSQFDTRAAAAQNTYADAFNNFNSQITGANNAFTNSAANTNYQQSMNQTIDSIAAKYGFTFNRDTARQNAEAEAQALRDANADTGRRNESANKTNLQSIDNTLNNAAEALDRNYFQQGLAQQQNQVNGGLNAGIAADQDLRLQFNRQAELGANYRQADLGRQAEQERFTNEQLRLADALGTINQQAIAKGNAGAQEQERYLYDVISNDRNFFQGAAAQEFDQSQALVNQFLAQQDRLTSNYQADRNFDYGALRDIIGDSQFDRNFAQGQFEQAQSQQNYNQQFNYNAGRDRVADNQFQQQFNLDRALQEAGLTGNYGGSRTLQGVASDRAGQQQDFSQQLDQANLQYNYDTLAQRRAEFNSEADFRRFEYNNLSASDRARFDQNASQFGEDLAFKLYEIEYNGNLQRSLAEAELSAYTGGNSNSASATRGSNTGSTSGSLRSSSNASLGSISAKYESNGNPATIARTKGDIGGASYGTYQLTTASGQATKFANQYGGALKGQKAGTAAFDKAWKAEAAKSPAAFAQAQHSYIEKNHYEPAANRFKSVTGIDPNSQPKAVRDAIWSIGVQHGAGGAATIFKNAGISKGQTAETILKKVYAERSKVDKYFKSSPANIKASVKNRFANELKDALSELKR